MKIAYIIDLKVNSKNVGVLNKINAQIEEWENQGHLVDKIYLFDFCPNIRSKLWFIPSKLITFVELYINSYFLNNHFKNKNYDSVYSRALIYTPFLNFLKKENYTIELNANDLDEFIKTSKIKYYYAVLTRHRIYSLAKRFIAVSREIKKYYESFNKPTEVIANACPNLKNIQKTHKKNSKPIIGFIGSNKFIWNGHEKVLELAKQMPQYQFEFIGFKMDQELNNTKSYGHIREEDSIEIMKRWNAAFSTMSLYEQKLKEASPLKSRLYLAMNIPFIYAYEDTDEPFTNCLKIPNTKNNVSENTEKIKKFLYQICSNPETTINHKCFLQAKEKKRLGFLTKLV